MKIRRLVFTFVILLSLSCNTVTQLLETPAPTSGALPTTAFVETVTPGETVPPELTASPDVPPDQQVFIPPDCQTQPLATVAPEVAELEPTPSLEPNQPIDTNEQLQVFDDLASTIEQNYLYPDFNGLDWETQVATYRAKVEAGLDTDAFYAQMQQFVIDLGDDHSQFETPVDVAASDLELAGTLDFVGIGALILPLVEKERITILAVFPDSPAEHAGLKQHDSILAVDGVPIVQGEDVQSYRTRGPECSAVVLTVQSPGEESRQIMLVRHRITTSEPIDARLVPTTDGSRIGYIFIPTFFDEKITGQIREALDSFGPLDGLILDNRMNGGGSSSVVEPILSFFVDGTVGHFVSRTEERPLNVSADPVQNSQTVPMVILVGEDTVSFGEIFSGALQDLGRAKLVGQTTLGNVETLHGHYFEDGSRAWIAEERFDPLNSHANWEQDGIHPDVEAYADWDTFTFENDPAVVTAVTLLGHS